MLNLGQGSLSLSSLCVTLDCVSQRGNVEVWTLFFPGWSDILRIKSVFVPLPGFYSVPHSIGSYFVWKAHDLTFLRFKANGV